MKVVFKYLMVLSVLFTISSCDKDEPVKPQPYDGETKEQWLAHEYSFESTNTYEKSFYDVDIDMIFTHEDGTELKVPGFWDGENIWKVRFAP
ncbi:MAG: DUF5060 domain-containing protein, partial [Bacteroidota bacterium]